MDLDLWNAAASEPGRQASHDRGLVRLDGVGLALMGLLGLWVASYSGDGGARPGPLLVLLVAVVAAVWVGRMSGRRSPVVIPAAVAAAVAGMLFLSLPSLEDTGGRPLGYANANATLAALGALAAVGAALSGVVARRDGPSPLPLAAGLGAGALGATTLIAASVAGALVLLVGVALVALALALGGARPAVLGGAAVLAVALGATFVISLGVDPVGLGERAEVRGELWEGAVDLVRESPARGHGPGTFAALNPVTRDPDLRWAHNGYVQVAAELGVPGLVVGLAVLVWIYVRLWAAAAVRHPVMVAVGAAAVTVLGLHATVDYVLHFPVLVLAVALLFGWATSPVPSSCCESGGVPGRDAAGTAGAAGTGGGDESGG